MSNTWFTSDPHLGHVHVAQTRGFTDPAEHDEMVIDSIRSVVRPGDQVWWLGDLTVGSPERALTLIATVPGEHHLILGNHEVAHPRHRDAHKHQRRYLDVFASVAMAGRRRVNVPDGAGRHTRYDVLLSHYPYATWDGQADHPDRDGSPQVRDTQWRLPDEGLWLLHGHTHMADQVVHDRQVHVGWDAWRRPVNLDEIAALIANAEREYAAD